MKYLQKFLCALQGKEKKIMEQLVWCKVKQFLEILRCEDIDRESRVDTQEFQMAKQKLHDKDIVYQQSIAKIPGEEREKIKDYVEMLKEYSFEECQQSYMQGMIDCMLTLSGAGILKPRKELEKIVQLLVQS
jgi:hypothetical protein